MLLPFSDHNHRGSPAPVAEASAPASPQEPAKRAEADRRRRSGFAYDAGYRDRDLFDKTAVIDLLAQRVLGPAGP